MFSHAVRVIKDASSTHTNRQETSIVCRKSMDFVVLIRRKSRQLVIPVALTMHRRLKYASSKQVEKPWQICWLHTYLRSYAVPGLWRTTTPKQGASPYTYPALEMRDVRLSLGKSPC